MEIEDQFTSTIFPTHEGKMTPFSAINLVAKIIYIYILVPRKRFIDDAPAIPVFTVADQNRITC